MAILNSVCPVIWEYQLLIIFPHAPKNDHIICHFWQSKFKAMGHAKTKVTVGCLFKSRLYQRTVSRNLCISLRRGHIKLSPCTFSLRWSLSLSLSLSLSNKTRVYWNVVVFAFQTQYIRGLFVRNNIDTNLLICTLYSLFLRESYVSPVILVLSVLW